MTRVQRFLRRVRHGRRDGREYVLPRVVIAPSPPPGPRTGVVLRFRDGSSLTLDPASPLAQQLQELAAQLRARPT